MREDASALACAHIHVPSRLTMASSETYTTKCGEIVEEESSDEEEDGIPYMEKLTSSIYLSRITSTGKVLWKQQIDDIGNKHAALQSEASKEFKLSLKTLPCHKYRSLLPPPSDVTEGTGGPLPNKVQDAQWLRSTMRSILAKAVEVEKAAKDDNESRTSIKVISFPVLAYRFFDKEDLGRDDDNSRLVEGLSLCSDPDQEARDGDRWALYHGVRQMMTEEDAEASLFFELLDEFNGQDALAFVLEVLAEVKNETKMELLSSSSCADPVFLPLSVALELTSRVFTPTTNRTESQGLPSCDLDSLTQRTMDLAVEKTGEGGQVELQVDLFQWLVFVAAPEYYREVCRRKSLARLLFETASSGALTSYCPKSGDAPGGSCKTATNGINFPQFEAVMEVLWRGIRRCEVDELYSRSYEFQRHVWEFGNDGITLEPFLHVADERRFFVRSRAAQSPRA